MRLIDTHCHIDAAEFEADRTAVLASARKAGVERIIVPAVTRRRWPGLMALCNQHDSPGSTPALYPALGLHPVFLDTHREQDLQALEKQLTASGAAAIGEIGLDYYLKDLDKDQQLFYLDAQLSIACQAGLPVILHCRKAYDELVTMLGRHPLTGGIAHAFNGSIQQAHKLIDIGLKLGFGGLLTYPHSTKLRNLAARLPLASMVLETDAPDMTVSQHQGKRNSPEYLPLVFSAMAGIREETPEDMEQQLYSNSIEVFFR